MRSVYLLIREILIALVLGLLSLGLSASSWAHARIDAETHVVSNASRAGAEVVQRAMSRAELEAMRSTGLVRGGREGTAFRK